MVKIHRVYFFPADGYLHSRVMITKLMDDGKTETCVDPYSTTTVLVNEDHYPAVIGVLNLLGYIFMNLGHGWHDPEDEDMVPEACVIYECVGWPPDA